MTTQMTFPDRKAEPGTEISWTDGEGHPRRLVASSSGRVPINDEVEEAEAKASGLPIFREVPVRKASDAPAAPAEKEA